MEERRSRMGINKNKLYCFNNLDSSDFLSIQNLWGYEKNRLNNVLNSYILGFKNDFGVFRSDFSIEYLVRCSIYCSNLVSNRIIILFLIPSICDTIFDNNDKMLKDVRETALKISNFFYDYIDLKELFIFDIQLTGSLTNFNWSSFSDFDLHIISKIPNTEVKTLIDSKRALFKKTHNIKIKNFQLEPYIQDIDETHTSMGCYSILQNEWVKKAEKESFNINDKSIIDKVNYFKKEIEESIKNEDEISLTKIFKKLKKYRKSGLEKKGELSLENIVFKYLRRDGSIEKLMNNKNKIIDKKLSLNN